MMDETRSLAAVPAVKWGRHHETFMEYMKRMYKDFIFASTGLVLHEDFPFLAPSPDGLFKCSCHPPSRVRGHQAHYGYKVLSGERYILQVSNYFMTYWVNEMI